MPALAAQFPAAGSLPSRIHYASRSLVTTGYTAQEEKHVSQSEMANTQRPTKLTGLETLPADLDGVAKYACRVAGSQMKAEPPQNHKDILTSSLALCRRSVTHLPAACNNDPLRF